VCFLAAGQERFRAITTSYYRGADGVIMVYDITDPNSLISLNKTWINEVRAYASKFPRIVLVGNKIDLRNKMLPETIIKVNELLQDIKEQMMMDGVVDIVEASSKTGQGVDFAFETMVDHILSNMNKAINVNSKQKKDIPVGISLFGSSGSGSGPDVRRGLCCNLL
jgi:Ras-related protein Rab-1A